MLLASRVFLLLFLLSYQTGPPHQSSSCLYCVSVSYWSISPSNGMCDENNTGGLKARFWKLVFPPLFSLPLEQSTNPSGWAIFLYVPPPPHPIPRFWLLPPHRWGGGGGALVFLHAMVTRGERAEEPGKGTPGVYRGPSPRSLLLAGHQAQLTDSSYPRCLYRPPHPGTSGGGGGRAHASEPCPDFHSL